MTDLLILAAYFLSILAVYGRIRRRFPAWELRAELAAVGFGLLLLAGLVVIAGGTPAEPVPLFDDVGRHLGRVPVSA